MDEFEDQVRNKREDLDNVEDLSTGELWAGIEERMTGQKSGKRIRLYQRWLVAASVLLLCSLGLAYAGWQDQEAQPTRLSDLSPELAQQEADFLKTISIKEAALNLDELDHETYASYFEELSLLDSLQTEYQEELPHYGANDRLLNTLIRYYELKIHLLEQLENDLAQQQYYGISNQPLEI
ncbi:MAG: hypothetical protein AB8H12_11570 [Lewinella sp.]